MTIQPIVEGQGEEAAFPLLLRRLLYEMGVFTLEVARPIRGHRSTMTREEELKHLLRLAMIRPGTSAVVVLFDADEECARDRVPPIMRWAGEVAPHLPFAVIMARQEYEAWFLASIESLRGMRRIDLQASYESDPERRRGAKSELSRFLPAEAKYHEPTDQPAFTQAMSLELAFRRSASFRKLVRELCAMCQALGLSARIPPEWSL